MGREATLRRTADLTTAHSSPGPPQSATRPGSELELLRNPQAFYPPNLTSGRRRHRQLMADSPWDPQVREEILQLHWRPHPRRLKTVASLPMPQHGLRTDLVGVEALAPRTGRGQTRAPRLLD